MGDPSAVERGASADSIPGAIGAALRIAFPFALGRAFVGVPYALIQGGLALLAGTPHALPHAAFWATAIGSSAAAATVLEVPVCAGERTRYPPWLTLAICVASVACLVVAGLQGSLLRSVLETGSVVDGVEAAAAAFADSSPVNGVQAAVDAAFLGSWGLSFAVTSAIRLRASLLYVALLAALELLGLWSVFGIGAVLVVPYGAVWFALLFGSHWAADRVAARASGRPVPRLGGRTMDVTERPQEGERPRER